MPTVPETASHADADAVLTDAVLHGSATRGDAEGPAEGPADGSVDAAPSRDTAPSREASPATSSTASTAEPEPATIGGVFGRGSLIDRFDRRVDRWWGSAFRGRPALDRAHYLASELADFSLLWQIVGAAQGLRSDPRDPEASLRLGVTLLTESVLVNQGIKLLFARERPVVDAPRPHHLRQPLSSSFPSGHASAAFTAAGVLSQRDPKLAPVYYAAAAFVATSRVHVQIHHPSDVVAGAALGAVFAKVATRLWPMPPRG